MNRMILASASPRRKELLSLIDKQFDILSSNADENVTEQDPVTLVEVLSLKKAEAVATLIIEKKNTKFGSDDTIYLIGADTIVVKDNQIMGKPKDEADAVRMLKNLQNATHKVCTGVTILVMKDMCIIKTVTFHEETSVTVYPMLDAEILNYVATKEPLDKAGAYGIQGVFGKFIKSVSGDYNNVVGLPVGRLYQELTRAGWTNA